MKTKKILLTAIFAVLFVNFGFSQFYLGTDFYRATDFAEKGKTTYSSFQPGLKLQYQFNKANLPVGSLNLGLFQTVKKADVANGEIIYSFLKTPVMYKLSLPGMVVNNQILYNFNFGLGYFATIPISIDTDLVGYNTNFVNHGLSFDMSFDFYMHRNVKASFGYRTDFEMFSTQSSTSNVLKFSDNGFYFGIYTPINMLFKTKKK